MNQDINSRIKKVTSLLKPAGDIFMRWLDEDNLGIEEKEKNDFVTLADKEIEQFLSREIMAEFPQDSIIREEFEDVQGSSEYKWVIDPIDGSNNYARKILDARIIIALIQGSKLVYGVIYNPTLSETYSAELGNSAVRTNLLNGKTIELKVSNRELSQSLIIYSAGLAKGDKQSIKILENIVGKIGALRLYGSAAVAFELIASGRADSFICNIAKPMDVAAGYLIIREAGGRVLNFSGSDWTLYDKDILVTNKENENELLQLLNI